MGSSIKLEDVEWIDVADDKGQRRFEAVTVLRRIGP